MKTTQRKSVCSEQYTAQGSIAIYYNNDIIELILQAPKYIK